MFWENVKKIDPFKLGYQNTPLSDDCLMHIFHQLPSADRIRIERGKIIHFFLTVWYCFNVYKLDILVYKCTQNFFNNYGVQEMENIKWTILVSCETTGFIMFYVELLIWHKQNICIIRKILFRCDSYLNEVNLSLEPYHLHQITSKY